MALSQAEKGPVKEKPLHNYPELQPSSTRLSHYGINSVQYNALSWISGSVVVSAAGKFVLFIDFIKGTITSQDGPEDGAVGVVAVHPMKQAYVVGERRPGDPKLQVYSWPTRELLRSFCNGADVGFSAIAFDSSGDRMASVASFPDFTLAVWDWESAAMILRSKCFSADVYTVAFSAFEESILVTGGSGHIKCWTMAQTFTGLKLQGVLGKFGRLEISDVSAFTVFPDGKVLSGSESGSLLLWEGDLVKCSLVRSFSVDSGNDGAGIQNVSNVVPCHEGSINYIGIHGKYVVSAGDDGYMRYWVLEELGLAEGTSVPPYYAPQCVLEVCVGISFRIRSVTLNESKWEWIVLDEYGSLTTTPYPFSRDGGNLITAESSPTTAGLPPATPILQFNGGPLFAAVMSPFAHEIITGGADGVVRVVNYVTGTERAKMQWPRGPRGPSAVSSIKLLRSSSSEEQLRLVVAFEDGTLRLLNVGSTITVHEQLKAHSAALCAIALSSDETRLAAVARDGTVFFFAVGEGGNALTPMAYCVAPLTDPLCAEWDNTATGSGGCLLGYQSGQLLSIQAPLPEEVNHDVGYTFSCRYELVAIRQRLPTPPKTEEELLQMQDIREDALVEEDCGPWPVVFVVHVPGEGIVVGMEKPELAYLYSGSVRYRERLSLPPLPPTGVEPPNYVETPQLNVCYRDRIPSSAYLSPNGALIIACQGAELLLRDSGSLVVPFLLGKAHDSTSGHITGAFVSFDGSMVVTTDTDGLVVSQVRKGYPPPSLPKISIPETTLVASEQRSPTAIASPLLSIQQQKEADDKERAEAARDKKLQIFLQKIEKLKVSYGELLDENSELPDRYQWSKEDMELDPNVREAMAAEEKRRVEEAQLEFLLQTTRDNALTAKLKRQFVDNLLFDRFQLYAFEDSFFVSSFRVEDPTASIAEVERQMTALLETEEEVQQDEGKAANMGNSSDGDNDLANAANEKAMSVGNANVIGGAPGGQGNNATTKSKISATILQQLDKMDARRQERQNRRDGYDAVLAEKPDPAVDDAKLQQQLEIDHEARGECVLRTDEEYRCEKEFRPTAVAKLQRLIQLERHIVEQKCAFNRDLLQQREEKRALLFRINALYHRSAQIRSQLGLEVEEDPTRTLRPEEEPEKMFKMDREQLDAYSKEKAEQRVRAEEAKKAQRGFGADLAGAQATEKRHASGATSIRGGSTATSQRRSKVSHAPSYQDRGSRQSTVSALAMRERMDLDLKNKLDGMKRSPLEEEEREMQEVELKRELRCLEDSINALQEEFNQKLRDLVQRRAAVDADACFAHRMLLLLYREFKLLLVYRSQDKTLRERVASLKREQGDNTAALGALQSSITEKEHHLRNLNAKLKSHNQEAEAFMEDNCPSDKLPYIRKVYHRHLKRRRHEDDDDGNDDITSDEDEEDEDDDIGEEARPSNCSTSAWDQMLVYRETRLDLVDMLAEAKKAIENFKQTHAAKESNGDAVVQKIKECKDEVKKLEAAKRRELNLLSTVAPLHLSQVRCLDGERQCPQDLYNASVTVISQSRMEQLHNRIYELANEKKTTHQQLTGMISELQQLKEEREATRKIHAGWEEKVHEVMMLKFGQHVDLELLESCGSSRAIETKKEELRQLEAVWERSIEKLRHQLDDLRSRLQDTIYENTGLLQNLGDFESERQTTDAALSQATSKTVQRYRKSPIATKQDRTNLRELIAAQQNEIDALNAEIMMLKRKGGHAYGPGTV